MTSKQEILSKGPDWRWVVAILIGMVTALGSTQFSTIVTTGRTNAQSLADFRIEMVILQRDMKDLSEDMAELKSRLDSWTKL